uniref:Uncharacterized protein n=1 Tax=Romanomermis culicivorax TaxID=13658 RepID=A0A915K1X6_ROMCU
MAAPHTLSFDQIMPPLNMNIMQSSALPVVPPILAVPAQANSLAPPRLSQNLTTATIICASASAVSQIPPPSIAAQANNDTTVAQTDSSDSFINIDFPQAPAATRASLIDHHSSLAITNANEVHNFRIEAGDALEQLSTPAV